MKRILFSLLVMASFAVVDVAADSNYSNGDRVTRGNSCSSCQKPCGKRTTCRKCEKAPKPEPICCTKNVVSTVKAKPIKECETSCTQRCPEGYTQGGREIAG